MPSFQPGAAIIGTTRLPARGSGFHQLGALVIAALRWSLRGHDPVWLRRSASAWGGGEVMSVGLGDGAAAPK